MALDVKQNQVITAHLRLSESDLDVMGSLR